MHFLEELSLLKAELMESFLNGYSTYNIQNEIYTIICSNKDELEKSSEEIDMYDILLNIFRNMYVKYQDNSYEEILRLKYDYLYDVLNDLEKIISVELEKEQLIRFFIYNMTIRNQYLIPFDSKIAVLETIKFNSLEKHSMKAKKDLLSQFLFLLMKQVPLNVDKILVIKNELKKMI